MHLAQSVDVSAEEFRALLDLYMCSDPWPVRTPIPGYADRYRVDDMNKALCEEFLQALSRKFGFSGWVDAYHEFKP